jgi:protein-L-isoaspartate(D-aspartate) O-methyltransferase
MTEDKDEFGPYQCEGLDRENIDDENVLKAMSRVPRHKFVPQEHEKFAYQDGALPIGSEQTISQPYIVALMTQEAEIKKGAKVLEIGTGSGYQAAVLSELGAKVFSIEIIPELLETANKTLRELNYENVVSVLGDGSEGLPSEAPFDAIIVTAASEEPPPRLLSQLKVGGRMIIPVKSEEGEGENLLRIIKTKEDDFEVDSLGLVKFVPLTHPKEPKLIH